MSTKKQLKFEEALQVLKDNGGLIASEALQYRNNWDMDKGKCYLGFNKKDNVLYVYPLYIYSDGFKTWDESFPYMLDKNDINSEGWVHLRKFRDSDNKLPGE